MKRFILKVKEAFHVYGWQTTFLDVFICPKSFRGFARLYFQWLTIKRDKSKMAATET